MAFLNFFTIVLFVGVIAQGYSEKIRLCVTRQVELNKCNDMHKSAQKHGLNVQFECILDDIHDCIDKTSDGEADAVVVDGHDYSAARSHNLEPVLYEAFGDDNVMVAIGDPDMTKEQIKEAAVDYNEKNLREAHAAMFLNKERGNPVCGGLKAGNVNTIKILKSSDLALDEYKNSNKKLICPTLERKNLNEYKNCHIEAHLVNAVFVPKGHKNTNDIITAFKSVVEHFGPSGTHNSDFKIFGKYKEENTFDNEHSIFSDDATDLLDKPEIPNGVNEKVFNEIHCHGAAHHAHHHPHNQGHTHVHKQ